MEWYDWVFAICGVGTAFALVMLPVAVYMELKDRAAGKEDARRRPPGR